MPHHHKNDKAPQIKKDINTQWGGRFSQSSASIMKEINASISFDYHLWRQDIRASRAHAAMLYKVGILTQEEEKHIQEGLSEISQEIEEGKFHFSEDKEDIHMNIEARLSEKIGDAGKRLHTARSRNDQVATDFRLWIRDALDGIISQTSILMQSLALRALEFHAAPMPGFTHLQVAQPITFGHHLLAYVEMFSRDISRLKDARKRMNECPLGSAALAGTSFPIDRQMTAELLEFDRPTANSLDTVSDRDFALEFLSALSLQAMHLSRLAEEIILWASAPFDFIHLSDRFTTGSSIMPQKRNPDAAELIRGKIGRIMGDFISLLTVMKALPLAYAKDTQEDKEPVFDATKAITLSLAAMDGMINDLQANSKQMYNIAGTGYSTATDLADWLVRYLKLPFRTAHHITGQLVSRAEQKNCDLSELSLNEMQQIEPKITEDIFQVLTIKASLHSRISEGGTAPALVKSQAETWLKRLSAENSSLENNESFK